jgi:NAD(P) transhydrogenase
MPWSCRPVLITVNQMIAAMKPGSVIVDLAAEAGGNCVATQPGKLIEHHGVTVIGLSTAPQLLQ